MVVEVKNPVDSNPELQKLMEIQQKLIQVTEEKVKIETERKQKEEERIKVEYQRIEEIQTLKSIEKDFLDKVSHVLAKTDILLDYIEEGSEVINESRDTLNNKVLKYLETISVTIPLNLEVNRTVVQYMVTVNEGNVAASNYFKQLLDKVDAAFRMHKDSAVINISNNTVGSVTSSQDSNLDIISRSEDKSI